MYKRKRSGPFGGGGFQATQVKYKKRRVARPKPKALSSGELKFHDVDLDDGVVDAAGLITPSINLIAQGVTAKTRVGRKCVVRSIIWKYSFTLPQRDATTSPEAGDTIRVIMYQDKQCNKATALSTDILETADYQSFRNLVQVGRFNILCDKIHTLNYAGLASDGVGVVSNNEVRGEGGLFKQVEIPIEFNDDEDDGRLTTITSNNIGVYLLSANGKMGFESKIRLRFSDN